MFLTETSCRRAIERAVERFGRLDFLVNNAGTTVRKAPEDLTAQDWHLVMNTSQIPLSLYGLRVRANPGNCLR
jgi:NAD(P)-dependent dehydrogenase (short-subunit alcohol dehydrogenase family)